MRDYVQWVDRVWLGHPEYDQVREGYIVGWSPTPWGRGADILHWDALSSDCGVYQVRTASGTVYEIPADWLVETTPTEAEGYGSPVEVLPSQLDVVPRYTLWERRQVLREILGRRAFRAARAKA